MKRRAASFLLLSTVLASCSVASDPTSAPTSSVNTAPTSAEPAADASASPSFTPILACGVVEHPRIQDGGHLIGDAEPPVPYSSNPPTSGWHASGAVKTGVQAQPLSDPEIVSVLEAGHVALVYDPDRLPAADQQRLEALATSTHEGALTIAPWAEPTATLAMAGWGTLQFCNRLDEDAIASFITEWAPEDHSH